MVERNTAQVTESGPIETAAGVYLISIHQPLCNFKPDTTCKTPLELLSITKEDSDKIELETRTQRKSSSWFLHRKGRITASVFKEVCSSRMVKCSSLINKLFRPTIINAPAVQYGIENEDRAKEAVLSTLRGSHTGARLQDCGLMIPPKYPYLGCSPDATFHCECHPPALVEIKCLYSLRKVHPSKVAEEGQKQRDFCLDAHGDLKLSHKYYYQVQAQLHLNSVGSTVCYFYLHVDQGGLLLSIPKEEGFMSRNEEKLKLFFQKIVLPRICSKY